MTKTKEMTIDLDVQMNPSPKLLQIFKENDAEHLFKGNQISVPAYKNEERIMVASRSSKKPIRHNLFSCYRIKKGSKEYFFAFDLMTTLDYMGNKISHTREIGRWEKPEIVTPYAINASSVRSDSAFIEPEAGSPSVESVTMVYDYEFEAMKPQIRKWKESGKISDETNFYVEIGSDTYGRYTFEEWLNLPIVDLELLGKFSQRIKGVYTQSGDIEEKIAALRTMLKEELKTGTLKA